MTKKTQRKTRKKPVVGQSRSPLPFVAAVVAAAVVGLVAILSAVRSRRAPASDAFPDAGGPPPVDTVEVVETNQPTDAWGED